MRPLRAHIVDVTGVSSKEDRLHICDVYKEDGEGSKSREAMAATHVCLGVNSRIQDTENPSDRPKEDRRDIEKSATTGQSAPESDLARRARLPDWAESGKTPWPIAGSGHEDERPLPPASESLLPFRIGNESLYPGGRWSSSARRDKAFAHARASRSVVTIRALSETVPRFHSPRIALRASRDHLKVARRRQVRARSTAKAHQNHLLDATPC